MDPDRPPRDRGSRTRCGRRNFDAIRRNVDRLDVRLASIEDYLAGTHADRVNRFNLSDIFEYMSESNYRALLRPARPPRRPRGGTAGVLEHARPPPAAGLDGGPARRGCPTCPPGCTCRTRRSFTAGSSSRRSHDVAAAGHRGGARGDGGGSACWKLIERVARPHPEILRSCCVGMGLVVISFPWVFDRRGHAPAGGPIDEGTACLKCVPPLHDGVGSVLTGVHRPSFGEVCFPLAVAAAVFVEAVATLLFAGADADPHARRRGRRGRRHRVRPRAVRDERGPQERPRARSRSSRSRSPQRPRPTCCSPTWAGPRRS